MLERSFHRFAGQFSSSSGYDFPGILMPIATEIPAGSIVEPRHSLRVRRDEVVEPGDVVTDAAWGERYIVGTHDDSQQQGGRIYRTLRLYKVTADVAWSRRVATIEPISGLAGATSTVPMGTIAVAFEPMGALERDRGTELFFERLRVITGAPIALGDFIGGKVVARITPVYGIILAESD